MSDAVFTRHLFSPDHHHFEEEPDMTRSASTPRAARSPSIVLNGERRELTTSSALDLVAEVTGRQLHSDGTPADGGRLGIAVAVDGEVIRRGMWSDFTLSDGHTVDIVTAVQGG